MVVLSLAGADEKKTHCKGNGVPSPRKHVPKKGETLFDYTVLRNNATEQVQRNPVKLQKRSCSYPIDATGDLWFEQQTLSLTRSLGLPTGSAMVLA